MKWWLFAKQFPKYALVFGIIAGSTALFAFWWIFHARTKAHSPRDTLAEQAAIHERAAKAEARIDYLFLADDDLYDAGTSECLFKNWLHGDHPLRLFFDPKSKKILGQYDRGFARYAFDGTREAAMMRVAPVTFFDDFKKIVFAKSKNVWVADVDWEKFRFANERQVTTIDSFYEQSFAENIILLTSKTLVVRNLNSLLRVNLETGNVKPVRVPLGDISKRRSPDSKWVIGARDNQFYCYDVDSDDAKTLPIGRTRINDCQWIGNDKCLCIADDKSIISYDRLTHRLTPVTTLPFACFKIGEPSLDGRFLFAAGGLGGRSGVLVDLEKKTAAPVRGGDGIVWVNNDTFAFSREVPDSELRGSWLHKGSDTEMRALLEPYFVSRRGPSFLVMPPVDLVVLLNRRGLVIMKPDGTRSKIITKQDNFEEGVILRNFLKFESLGR